MPNSELHANCKCKCKLEMTECVAPSLIRSFHFNASDFRNFSNVSVLDWKCVEYHMIENIQITDAREFFSKPLYTT